MREVSVHWKTIGHLFYATSSFVHHLVAIGEFKLHHKVRDGDKFFFYPTADITPKWDNAHNPMRNTPDSKVHGANMGPPMSCWSQVGPMLAP